MENYKNINELEIDTILLKNVVHEFLEESEKFNFKCLDLEEEISNDLIQWIKTNQEKLKMDFKNFYPKTLPLMRELENLLKKKVSLDRVKIEGSDRNFRINKVSGVWASEIYDKVLERIFKKNN